MGCCQAVAQPRSIGALFSHTLTGVQLDIASSELACHTLTLAANMPGRRPVLAKDQGYYLSYDCNFTVLSNERPSGIISFFCGPQIVAGINQKSSGQAGFNAGLGIVLGTEYEFYRHIAIGLRISPSAGFSIQRTSEYASMTFCSSTLAEGAIPQITIKYCFF